jgi:pantothenate kinase type III
MPALVLSVDIGNTNVHAGLVDCDRLVCLGVDAFPTSLLKQRLCASIASLVPNSVTAGAVPLVICSVVKVDRAEVSGALGTFGMAPPRWFEYSPAFPVSVAYNDPRTVGVDRLADCLYSQAAYPGESRIIIDAGTATKVDVFSKGNEFAGGVILPGIAMQLKSLHDHTSALPLVEPNESAIEFPGTSTKSAMTAGATYGTAGALSFLVDRYRQKYGNVPVLATGGAWKQVERLVTFEFEYVKDMTLVGTGLFERVAK